MDTGHHSYNPSVMHKMHIPLGHHQFEQITYISFLMALSIFFLSLEKGGLSFCRRDLRRCLFPFLLFCVALLQEEKYEWSVCWCCFSSCCSCCRPFVVNLFCCVWIFFGWFGWLESSRLGHTDRRYCITGNEGTS